MIQNKHQASQPGHRSHTSTQFNIAATSSITETKIQDRGVHITNNTDVSKEAAIRNLLEAER